MYFIALVTLAACNRGNPGSLHFEAYVADSFGVYQKKVDYLGSALYPAKDSFFHDKTFYTGHWKIRVDRMTDSEMRIFCPWMTIKAESRLHVR